MLWHDSSPGVARLERYAGSSYDAAGLHPSLLDGAGCSAASRPSQRGSVRATSGPLVGRPAWWGLQPYIDCVGSRIVSAAALCLPERVTQQVSWWHHLAPHGAAGPQRAVKSHYAPRLLILSICYQATSREGDIHLARTKIGPNGIYRPNNSTQATSRCSLMRTNIGH